MAATCAVLDKSCQEIDPTFVLQTFNVSLSSTGAATLITCTGITTRKPYAQKKCNNESLYPPFAPNHPNVYTFPLFPCNVLLGTNAASNDDWVEIISPSGNVTYKCEIGGNDVE